MNKKIALLILTIGYSILSIAQSESIKYGSISFDWNFESGSLDTVKIKNAEQEIDMMEFDIYSKSDPKNPADTLLPPSARWYYFKMSGVKDKKIKLNVHNSDARRPFYSYDGINFSRFDKESCPDNKSITATYDRDSVYIAYFVPYTVTMLNQKMDEWAKKDDVEIISLGKSEEGRDMPMLIITTDAQAEKHRLQNNGMKGNRSKKRIYIHGRIHTSEAPGTWHLVQMIDVLTDSSAYSKSLRDNAIFYVLPFTNPDGVANGLSRSNAKGINLEVNHDNPDSLTAQEVKNIRKMLLNITSDGKAIDLFLNMHSQSNNFATYWIHTAESSTPSYYRNLMLLANLTIQDNPYFKKNNLSFSKIAPRYLEGWFWNNYGEKTLAVTYETPYTFYDNDPDGEWVTIENLQQQATNNVNAVNDLLQLSGTERIILNETKDKKKMRKAKDENHFYFGDSYYIARKKGAYVNYTIDNLNKGEYDVYKWQVGKNKRASDEGENEWKYIGTHKQTVDGKFIFNLEAKKRGEKIDNLLLIKKLK